MKRIGLAVLLSSLFFAVGCGGPTVDETSPGSAVGSTPQALPGSDDDGFETGGGDDCDAVCQCDRKCRRECHGDNTCANNCRAECKF